MKNFIFDLYGTVIDISIDGVSDNTWQPVAEYFNRHGMKVTAAELFAGFDHYKKLIIEREAAERKFVHPECDGISVFECLARGMRGKLTRDQASEAYMIYRSSSIRKFKAFDGIKELLTAIRSRGGYTYILANAQSVYALPELESVGLRRAFDGITISSDCGCKKPDPAFFEMLFDQFGLDKSDSVMIGDDIVNDVRAAHAFGLQAVWAEGGAPSHAEEILGRLEGGAIS